MKTKYIKVAILGVFLLVVAIGMIMLFLDLKSNSLSITEGDYLLTVEYEKQSFNHSANIEVTAFLRFKKVSTQSMCMLNLEMGICTIKFR